MKQDFNIFDSTIKSILNRQAPLTKKYVRVNDWPYIVVEIVAPVYSCIASHVTFMRQSIIYSLMQAVEFRS